MFYLQLPGLQHCHLFFKHMTEGFASLRSPKIAAQMLHPSSASEGLAVEHLLAYLMTPDPQVGFCKQAFNNCLISCIRDEYCPDAAINGL